MCGGSIISKRYILTAAHCVQKHFATLTVILGSKNRTDASEEGQVRISTPGTNKIIHPDWDKKNYDIALIKLEEDIIMTDRIQPIDLPSFSQISESFAEQIGIASGFGRDYPMPFRSDLLIYAGLRVMSVEDCKKLYPNRPEVVCGDSSKGATCSVRHIFANSLIFEFEGVYDFTIYREILVVLMWLVRVKIGFKSE